MITPVSQKSGTHRLYCTPHSAKLQENNAGICEICEKSAQERRVVTVLGEFASTQPGGLRRSALALVFAFFACFAVKKRVNRKVRRGRKDSTRQLHFHLIHTEAARRLKVV